MRLTEERRFIYVVAFLLIYGLGSLFESGTFLLPIPFMELILLIASIPLIVARWSVGKVQSVLIGTTVLFYVLMRSHNHLFWMGDEALSTFESGPILDLIQLLFYLSFVALFSWEQKQEGPESLTAYILPFAFLLLLFLLWKDLPFLLWILAGFRIYFLQKNQLLWTKGFSFWVFFLSIDLCTKAIIFFLA